MTYTIAANWFHPKTNLGHLDEEQFDRQLLPSQAFPCHSTSPTHRVWPLRTFFVPFSNGCRNLFPCTFHILEVKWRVLLTVG